MEDIYSAKVDFYYSYQIRIFKEKIKNVVKSLLMIIIDFLQMKC